MLYNIIYLKIVNAIIIKPLSCVRRRQIVHLYNRVSIINFFFTEITCTQTSLLLALNVNVTNVKQSYIFNEEVTMSCNYGFSGNTVVARCTDVNTWSEKTPNCTSNNFIF